MNSKNEVTMEVMLGKPELTKAMEKFDTDPRDKRIAELEAENKSIRDLVGKAWDHVADMNGMDLPATRKEWMDANGLGEG